jgi:DNA-binding MarR family transcriptional regulator
MEELREFGMLVAKIHQVAGRIFARKLKEYNIMEINPAQGRILFVLWNNDGISIRQLSEKTLLKKSTLTSMLDRLENMGYLLRIPSENDRRKIIIKRTEKDKAFQELYLQVSREMTELVYKGFTEEEINQLESWLGKILDNLTTYDKKN